MPSTEWRKIYDAVDAWLGTLGYSVAKPGVDVRWDPDKWATVLLAGLTHEPLGPGGNRNNVIVEVTIRSNRTHPAYMKLIDATSRVLDSVNTLPFGTLGLPGAEADFEDDVSFGYTINFVVDYETWRG